MDVGNNVRPLLPFVRREDIGVRGIGLEDIQAIGKFAFRIVRVVGKSVWEAVKITKRLAFRTVLVVELGIMMGVVASIPMTLIANFVSEPVITLMTIMLSLMVGFLGPRDMSMMNVSIRIVAIAIILFTRQGLI
ncbi:MAG: hypothetical protein LBC11_02125 [Puniceicoccales bacterium]|jgi:hypothetical protein|nr:hypothetical protein [Puniceicoccales bacterium]